MAMECPRCASPIEVELTATPVRVKANGIERGAVWIDEPDFDSVEWEVNDICCVRCGLSLTAQARDYEVGDPAVMQHG